MNRTPSDEYLLSSYTHVLRGRIERDAAIASIGFLTHDRPRMLVFVEESGWLDALRQHPSVAGVITTEALTGSVPDGIGLVVAESPRRSFFDLHEYLLRSTSFYGTPGATRVADSARVHHSATVAPSGVSIGDRALVDANVSLSSGTVLEDEVVVGPGCIVASEGFQVLLQPGARPRRVAHGGSVRIAEGAELRAHCCVDRGLFGSATTIGEDSTLDHFVYVAHDVQMGRRCRVGAGAVINGGVSIGDEVWIGPNATIANGVTIGHGAHVSLGSVVTRDVPPNATVTGNFAVAHERFLAWLRSIR